jgi:hypothetical protein
MPQYFGWKLRFFALEELQIIIFKERTLKGWPVHLAVDLGRFKILHTTPPALPLIRFSSPALPRTAPRYLDGLEFAEHHFRRRSFRQVKKIVGLIYFPCVSDGAVDNSSQVCSCQLNKGFDVGLVRR